MIGASLDWSRHARRYSHESPSARSHPQRPPQGHFEFPNKDDIEAFVERFFSFGTTAPTASTPPQGPSTPLAADSGLALGIDGTSTTMDEKGAANWTTPGACGGVLFTRFGRRGGGRTVCGGAHFYVSA
jgi:hypothetical protein